MKHFIVEMIAESAFRHGQGYSEGRIYRNTGKYIFKNPHVLGLPDYVLQMPIEDHSFLEKVYKHAFRQGLKKGLLK
jgi:hypothetical protein